MFIASALAKGTSLLHHVLDSADLERTRDILQNTGAKLEDLGNGSWKVTGMENTPRGGLSLSPADCFVGESGTTCRLLTALLAAGHGSFRIHGAGRMHKRPIGTLTEAISALGAVRRNIRPTASWGNPARPADCSPPSSPPGTALSASMARGACMNAP
jgi:3-phosphoshikimate 1-carboxyvinyltransferase